MPHDARCLIAGRWTPASTLTHEQVDEAVAALAKAASAAVPPAHERRAMLTRAATLIEQRRDSLVDRIVDETGFTTKDAHGEIRRCSETLRLCGEEAGRLGGEVVPLEGSPGGTGRIAFTLRVPLGVICAITPFNAPLNTPAHKVGPALAAGNAVVLKPASQTPKTAEGLFQALLDAGTPPQLLALLHGPGARVGGWLASNPIIQMYAFTGSTKVGRELARAVAPRRTQLELGSISSTIVCADADLDAALPKIIAAGFRKAGQVCTSIQRLYIERGVFDDFSARLVRAVGGLVVGDPRQADTDVGPMIETAEAERAQAWIEAAVAGGARVLTGGSRDGAVLTPTLVTDVPADCELMQREAFAPIVCLLGFDRLEDAIAGANATAYGLSAGIFTRDLERAFAAARELDVGSVHINETSSSRIDRMPYGGTKDSGVGLEGPAYAVREMTRSRLITIRPQETP